MDESCRSPSVTMVDVLEQQAAAERDAHAVLGGSDDAVCTWAAGYVKRQALYACLTCTPTGSEPAGICLACSLACHERHELLELYTKRSFRCDCGGPKFERACTLGGRRDQTNGDNKYNHNFNGLYCQCERPYPDPDQSSDDDMIQCVVCEDWLHAGHLDAKLPKNDRYAEMICQSCADNNSFLKDYLCFAVTNDEDETLDDTANLTLDTTQPVIHSVISTGARATSDNVKTATENVEGDTQNKLNGNVLVDDADQRVQCDSILDDVPKIQPIQMECDENPPDASTILPNEESVIRKDVTSTVESKKTLSAQENFDVPIVQTSLETDSDNQFSPSPKIELENENFNEIFSNAGDSAEISELSTEGEICDLKSDVLDENRQIENNMDILKDIEAGAMPNDADILNDIATSITPSYTDTKKIPNASNDTDTETVIMSNDVDMLKDVETIVTPKNKENESETVSAIEISTTPIITDPSENNDLSTDDNMLNCTKTGTSLGDFVNAIVDIPDLSESLDNLNDLSNRQDVIPKTAEMNSSEDVEIHNKDDQKLESIETSETENTSTRECSISVPNEVSIDTIQNGEEVDKAQHDSATNGETIDGVTECEMDPNDEIVLKRKIERSVDSNCESIKKQKLNSSEKCIRPVNDPPIEHKGAIFWPCDWRSKLCICPVCTQMYKAKNVSYLLDIDDTVIAYENLGRTRTSASQYEKGLEALSSLDRIQQINAITEYNKMKEKLLEFLKTFKDKREVVREEDIKGFFAGMKPKREPDGVYFCR